MLLDEVRLRSWQILSGMSVDALKRQVGWKSSSVANGYIEESTSNKIVVSKRITGVLNTSVAESTSSTPTFNQTVKTQMSLLVLN